MLLGVDVGGTFTDAVLVQADGLILTAKVPTTPHDQSEGVLSAIEAVLAKAGKPASDVERLAHGMTVATNALLEGNVAKTALLATEGFTDIVELRRQARPSLYKLCLASPAPLCPPSLRFGVRERMTPQGPLLGLERAHAEQVVEQVAKSGVDAVAIVLLHSYAHPQHELLLSELVRAALPDAHVSVSHQLVGTFREYERAATTEIDAALSPLIARYLHSLSARTQREQLPQPQIMQSSGGLISLPSAAAHGALTLLSGPAGGVQGATLLASLLGEQDLLCLDIGGTSCDVCLVTKGEVTETADRTIAQRPLALPTLDIHTIGAGGGSIAWCDGGGALRVGPRSAGSAPGPACYGNGGREPTLTDANLVLGRLPAGISLPGGIKLDLKAAERTIDGLASSLSLSRIACAEGIVRVAEAEMLRALRVISVERGVDPRKLTLVGFGGAGPLHAASLASSLRISRVICPAASGVLSALGLAVASERRDLARSVMLSCEQLRDGRFAQERDALMKEVVAMLDGEDGHARHSTSEIRVSDGEDIAGERRGGGPPTRPALRVLAEMRYEGQSFELAIDASSRDSSTELRAAFEQAHRERYGYIEETSEVELVTLRVSASRAARQVQLKALAASASVEAETTLTIDGALRKARRIDGEPARGTHFEGPLVIALAEATVFVPPDWRGSVDARGTIVLDDEAGGSR